MIRKVVICGPETMERMWCSRVVCRANGGISFIDYWDKNHTYEIYAGTWRYIGQVADFDVYEHD